MGRVGDWNPRADGGGCAGSRRNLEPWPCAGSRGLEPWPCALEPWPCALEPWPCAWICPGRPEAAAVNLHHL